MKSENLLAEQKYFLESDLTQQDVAEIEGVKM